jgi:branched-chain amino acid transport system substrate-binding protein
MVRKLLPLFLILGLVFALAGCGATAAPTKAPEPTQAQAAPTAAEAGPTKVFKLGIQGPFSGPNARTGAEFKCSVNMAFDAINWTIGDYKIEPVWIDCQSDPAKATQAYEQAVVQDGVQAGILNWHSSVAVALMEVTAKYKIPHWFTYGATEVVNETFASDPAKYDYWNYKGWPAPAKLSISYVQALNDAIDAGTWKPEAKTVHIMGEDTDWGRSFGTAIKKQLEDTGWTTIGEEYFPIDQTEFYPLLNKIKELNPALIAGTIGTAPTVAAFIKQADEVGIKSLMVVDGLGWTGEWYNLTGASSNYIIDQIPGWATQAGKDFATAFKAKCNLDPSASSGGLSYDSANEWIAIAKEVIKAKGELTSESLYTWTKENISTGKWEYKDGIVMTDYKYTPETIPDPVVGRGYYIFPVLQYFDGVGKIIYPPDWAEQQLQVKP